MRLLILRNFAVVSMSIIKFFNLSSSANAQMNLTAAVRFKHLCWTNGSSDVGYINHESYFQTKIGWHATRIAIFLNR